MIVGAVYSGADTPPVSDPNKFMIRFKDGALLEYDRVSHTLTVSGVQNVLASSASSSSEPFT